MTKKIFWYIINIINILLILTTFIMAIIVIIYPDLMKNLIERIESIIKIIWDWNYLLAFLSAMIESFPIIWMIIPGQTVLLLIWWFFDSENVYYLIIVSSLWAILWNYIWFLLWYFSGDNFFKKYWDWFWIWLTELEYIKSWIHKYWAFAVIMSKFHNMTRVFIPFIAGSMWMKHMSFFIYNILWSIIWASSMIVLWVFFSEYYEIILDNFWYIMTFILVISWFYIYFFKYEKVKEYIRKKEKEIEDKYKK